jgi:hypothetical protein
MSSILVWEIVTVPNFMPSIIRKTRTYADRAQAFANHLASVVQPHPPEPDSLLEDTLTSFLETPFQLKPPIQRLKRPEVQAIIKKPPS